MDHSPDKRYTFLKPLGQGSYGTAWLAEDTVMGKLLVFKEINKASSSVSDFRRELRYSKYLSGIQTTLYLMILPMRPRVPTL